jgi:hypothetical protein
MAESDDPGARFQLGVEGAAQTAFTLALVEISLVWKPYDLFSVVSLGTGCGWHNSNQARIGRQLAVVFRCVLNECKDEFRCLQVV